MSLDNYQQSTETRILFKMPEFLTHNSKCTCFACANPFTSLLTLQITGLEASLHFKREEYKIGEMIFNGALRMFDCVDLKIKHYIDNLKGAYDDFVLDIVEQDFYDESRRIQLDILIEYTFLLIAIKNNSAANDTLVSIQHLLSKGETDHHLLNNYENLLSAVTKLNIMQENDNAKDSASTNIDAQTELEKMKLSPQTSTGFVMHTPINQRNKPPVYKINSKIYGNEDLPQFKRKVIKLNLDDVDIDNQQTQPQTTNVTSFSFKIPPLRTPQTSLETITPMKNTPMNSTSNTIKYYSAKSGSQNSTAIPVCSETSTPKVIRKIRNKSLLRRTTASGEVDNPTKANGSKTRSKQSPEKKSLNLSSDEDEANVYKSKRNNKNKI